MTTKSAFRLSLSPLTLTFYAGRVKQKDGYAVAVGTRHDVTSDVFACMIQFAEAKGGEFEIINGGGDVWDVTITKRAALAARE